MVTAAGAHSCSPAAMGTGERSISHAYDSRSSHGSGSSCRNPTAYAHARLVPDRLWTAFLRAGAKRVGGWGARQPRHLERREGLAQRKHRVLVPPAQLLLPCNTAGNQVAQVARLGCLLPGWASGPLPRLAERDATQPEDWLGSGAHRPSRRPPSAQPARNAAHRHKSSQKGSAVMHHSES